MNTACHRLGRIEVLIYDTIGMDPASPQQHLHARLAKGHFGSVGCRSHQIAFATGSAS
jgi:hypothetical protein